MEPLKNLLLRTLIAALVSALVATGSILFVVDQSLRGIEVAVAVTNDRFDDLRAATDGRFDDLRARTDRLAVALDESARRQTEALVQLEARMMAGFARVERAIEGIGVEQAEDRASAVDRDARLD